MTLRFQKRIDLSESKNGIENRCLNVLFTSLESSHVKIFSAIEERLREVSSREVITKILDVHNLQRTLKKHIYSIIDLKGINLALQYISKFQPDILVVAHDGGINATFIKICRIKGVPSLAIQDGILTKRPEKGIMSFLLWKKGLFWRIAARFSELSLISKFSLRLGWRTRAPIWGLGGATMIAVMGNFAKEVFQSRGVSASRLVVTGYPLFDRIKETFSVDEKIKVFQSLGLDEEKPMVVWITNSLGPNEPVINSILSTDSVQLVVKLHPRANPEDYEQIISSWHKRGKKTNLVVVKDFDLYSLIASCDVAVTVSSTVGLLVLALQKPLIVVDIPDQANFENILKQGADEICANPEKLSKVLIKIHKKTHVKISERKKEFFSRHLFRLDGKSSERIAKIILRLTRTREK